MSANAPTITSDGRADAAPDDNRGLVYPCGEPPAPGQVTEIAPGLLWLRMPLPFALNHINLWAIADEDEQGPGWAIVDTGTKTPEALDAWRQLTAPEGPLAAYLPGGRTAAGGARLTRVLVTHMHPDHVGMAGWLTRKFQCRLWMTRLEYLTCRMLVADTGREAPDEAIRFYRRVGWPEEAIDTYRARFGGFGKYMHALPESYRRLSDGETLRIGAHDWRVVVGRGHSPEHACLLSESLGVMISGDQVLPRISSNVSVFPTEPDADPLADWIGSIDRLRATLGDEWLVLPAHGEPFRGLHARLDRLAAGHQRGLERLRRSLVEPKRAIDVFGALFARPIDSKGELLGMATGESLAHLNHLLARGEAVREEGADGVLRFRMA
ncbi:MBL fold metallo-hydrolase [Aquincola sp. S2]|uniref:MBL fold metallo-hydrolase n=1 Tax=Pseudaquabacterium terrae TaxID=2732868 RepID=A0ABX2EPC2_9BURK|nr:MBL fold metallo-hydrolase [Aquabacterium terrae]NRF70402.1 MBL fold metallo-hydrolase [Aquabacterium terrae]